jgi:hypothetical protein
MRDSIKPCYTSNNVIANGATTTKFLVGTGSVFYYHQLEDDHPAIQFAREHNPDFDEILTSGNQ